MRTRLGGLTALAVAAVLWPAWASGQSDQGRLSGVVRDSSGGAMQGVTVTVTNQATQATRTARTSADGTYAVENLAPGTYTVTAELLGFRKVLQPEVQVSAGGAALDITMEALLAEEITVTAMLREQQLQDVPFSVAAPSEEVLRNRGVVDLEGVAANVGGFTVQNLGPGKSQVAMRGVSTGQIVRDQPGVKEQVGVYLDDSVVSLSLFTPDLDLFDTNRVEVLRGPQGTLFGSGSLAGTVRYITNQPALGLKKLFAEVGAGTIQDGNQTGSAKLGFNAPLGDSAALRAVGYYHRYGGWIDTPATTRSGGVVRADPGRLIEDVNTGYRAGGRLALRFVPNDRLSITPRIVYQKLEMDGWNRQDVYNILANPFTTTRPRVTPAERQAFSQLDEVFTDEFYLGDVTFNYDFGDVVLTSISTYISRDILDIRDTTSLAGSITGGSIGLDERAYSIDAPLKDATKVKVFTEELRLSGGKDRLSWVLGGFYSHTDRDYGQDLPVLGFEAVTGIPTAGLRAPRDSLFWSELGYKLDQVAGFGEVTFSATDKLDVTAGLRFYHFSEDKEQIFDGIFGNDNNGVSLVSQPGTTDASGIAPRLILSYAASEKTRLNAQVSRGFRLGGINDPLNVPLCTAEDLATFGGRESWSDETVWNYEVGAKSRVFGNRGTLNVAAFYMDIRDLQATVTAGSCSSRLIFNVPEARSQGFEVDFEVSPSDSFDLSISGSVNDSELRSSVNPVAVTGIREGRRLPTVPQFQMAAAATYRVELSGGATGYITGSYHHVGSRFTQVNDPDLGRLNMLSFEQDDGLTIGGPLTQPIFTYDPELPAYDLVNLRLGVRREKWDVSLYVNNLTDENPKLSFDRERGTRARIFYHVGQPRTIGVVARFDLGL